MHPTQANPIPDYDVTVPSEVEGLFSTALGWAVGIGITVLVLALIVGIIMFAVGSLNTRPDMAANGKKTIGVTILAAALLGLPSVIIFTVFSEMSAS